ASSARPGARSDATRASRSSTATSSWSSPARTPTPPCPDSARTSRAAPHAARSTPACTRSSRASRSRATSSRPLLGPATARTEGVLAVAAECCRGGQRLVDREVTEEATLVGLRADAERPEHMTRLPPLQEAEDSESDRDEQHRPPAEDQRVAEEEE